MAAQNNATVNENTVRIIAFFVAVLVLFFLLSGNIILFIFLTADFAIRGFGFKQYSLLRFIADKINDLFFGGARKPMFAPPKSFAAKIGLLFCVAIIIFFFTGWLNISNILAVVLGAFALLESLGNICVGCYIYNFIRKTGLLKS
ncbi:MAG: DUF4395 domain-containing protein [Sphingobacteriales bacterium]